MYAYRVELSSLNYLVEIQICRANIKARSEVSSFIQPRAKWKRESNEWYRNTDYIFLQTNSIECKHSAHWNLFFWSHILKSMHIHTWRHIYNNIYTLHCALWKFNWVKRKWNKNVNEKFVNILLFDAYSK